MRIFKESKQKHLYFSAAFALSLALAPTGVYAGTNTSTAVQAVQQNGNHKVTGRVVDSTGEPLIGATILVEGTTKREARLLLYRLCCTDHPCWW